MSYTLPGMFINGSSVIPVSADNLNEIINAIKDLDVRTSDNELYKILWSIDPASANSVQRIRHSTQNFLPNASFDYWLAGVNTAPSNWFFGGGVAISRSSLSTTGLYSPQLTFGTTDDGVFYTDIGADTSVDYTFSCYAQRLSGIGGARLVAQQDFGPFTEYVSVNLSTAPGWQAAMLTFKPTVSGLTRFSIHSADHNSSVWVIDEAMAQESKGVATTWQPSVITDSFDQTIFGNKFFKGVLAVPSSTTSARPSASASGVGATLYDTTLSKPVWSDGVAWRDASGVIV